MGYDSGHAGTNPKPTALQIAEGDRRKHGRIKLTTKAIPQPARGLPDCPHYLRGRARSAWNTWRSELDGMEPDAAADAMMLEAASVNYETAVRAHLQIRRQGEALEDPVISRDTGQIIGYRTKKNPWVAIRERAHRLLLAFCSEFGVSPAARTRLNVTVPSHADEDIDTLLRGPMLTDEEKQKMQR